MRVLSQEGCPHMRGGGRLLRVPARWGPRRDLGGAVGGVWDPAKSGCRENSSRRAGDRGFGGLSRELVLCRGREVGWPLQRAVGSRAGCFLVGGDLKHPHILLGEIRGRGETGDAGEVRRAAGGRAGTRAQSWNQP